VPTKKKVALYTKSSKTGVHDILPTQKNFMKLTKNFYQKKCTANTLKSPIHKNLRKKTCTTLIVVIALAAEMNAIENK